jgi:hypothetical protein
MLDITKETVVGVFIFLYLLGHGVIQAITSAKWEIINSLLSTLLKLDPGFDPLSLIPTVMILTVIVLVFLAIPGTIGFLRMLTE